MYWRLPFPKHITVYKCKWGKNKIVFCIGLIISLSAIQFVYVFILTKRSAEESIAVVHFRDTDQRLNSVAEAFSAPVVIDSSDTYQILKWIIKPRFKRQFKSLNITGGETALVTQCSSDHFYRLAELRRIWEGPISVSVFASSYRVLVDFVRLLTHIIHCQPSVLDDVSVHIVAPKAVSLARVQVFRQSSQCLGSRKLLKNQKNTSNYNNNIPYPNNLLRNVAIDAAVSDFTFVIDIDMLPSAKLFSRFRDFIRRGTASYSVAYVVPVFEVHVSELIPKNRQELLHLWNRKAVQPFYHDVCWKCQRYTDYSSWYNLSSADSEQLGVGYVAKWHDPWEPFYIVPHFSARYDERFKQYGFNRISQVSLNMCIFVVCSVNLCDV